MHLLKEIEKISKETKWTEKENDRFATQFKPQQTSIETFYDYNAITIINIIKDMHEVPKMLKDLLVLTGLIGLTQALYTYQNHENYSFHSYEKRVIYNQMILYLRRYEKITTRQYIPNETKESLSGEIHKYSFQDVKNCMDAFDENDFDLLAEIYSQMSLKQQQLFKQYFGLDRLEVKKLIK